MDNNQSKIRESEIFESRRKKLDLLKAFRDATSRKPKTEDTECPGCGSKINNDSMRQSMYICEHCGHYFPMPFDKRLEDIYDDGKYEALFTEVEAQNPINFPGYKSKLADLKSKTGMEDACISVKGKIGGYRAVTAILDTRFLMGSMGTAVGEKITLAAEYAAEAKLPLIIFSSSGGARMQEGIFSLMQMAKTSAAVKRHSDNGGLFISVLSHPTTGGVTASFASLGDIILAEPKALIGFAGPRVIEQTIGEKLPEGFQLSEFQLEHGFVDAVVPRGQMRDTLAHLLKLHRKGGARR